MEWYCGKCPKNKAECDFCKTILGDDAKLYASGEITKEYEPALTIRGYSYNRELYEFLDDNKLGVRALKEQYPDEDRRNAEILESHYQVGKESFDDGNFELSMNFFQNTLGYKDSDEYFKKSKFAFEKQNRRITEQKYEQAIELYENAQVKQARELFFELGDYLDSKQRYEKLNKVYTHSVRTFFAVFGAFIVLVIIVLIVF